MSILTKLLSGGAAKLVESVGGVIDNLHTSKEEKLAAELKIKELIASYEIEMQKQVTERWKMDMQSDSVIGAYFGGRSLEKVKNKL